MRSSKIFSDKTDVKCVLIKNYHNEIRFSMIDVTVSKGLLIHTPNN